MSGNPKSFQAFTLSCFMLVFVHNELLIIIE